MNHPDQLSATLRRITDESLSPVSRAAHVALLLVSLALTIVLVSLLATEPALPTRTLVSFGSMTAIGLAWVAYASWVLRHRRSLLANQRVVAARMALLFSLVFTGGAGWLGFADGQPAMRWAASLGAVMAAVAIGILVRAHRHRAGLLARRRQLEKEIQQANPDV